MIASYHILRSAEIWVSTQKAAQMCGMGPRWVQKWKSDFEFRRKGKRNLEFEITSVLKVAEKLQEEKLVA